MLFITVSSDLFIFYAFVSSCFHLLMFSGAFFADCISPLHCFFTVCQVLRFSAVVTRVLRIWEIVFYLTLLPAFFKAFLGQQLCLEGCRASHWGSKHRLGPSVSLNRTLFGNCMISREIYLNYSKYSEKLLVGKTVINFKHFSRKCYRQLVLKEI